jgi:hypothetical protein
MIESLLQNGGFPELALADNDMTTRQMRRSVMRS